MDAHAAMEEGAAPVVADKARFAPEYEAITNGALQDLFDSRFRHPSDKDIATGEAERLAGYRDRLWAIVPMAEMEVDQDRKIPTAIKGGAKHLTSRLHRSQFRVINAASHAENVAAAREGGAIVIDQDDVFTAVNWDKLLPILNRDARPVGRAGKGFTVLAGHLVLAALGLPSSALVYQSDAEIEHYDRYNPLSRLLTVLDAEPTVRHAKMAKHGRNNETSMAARAMLQNLFRMPYSWIPTHVRRYAKEVFEATGADKWMLTGEWISSADMVTSRLLATGYLEETFQAVWSVHAPACGAQNVRYVANPHDRADGANSARKEDVMMESISIFLHALVMHGRAPSTWNLRDIQEFNRTVMPELGTLPIIGQDNGPVHVHEIKSERIMPSVNMLLRHGFVDLEKVREIVASTS